MARPAYAAARGQPQRPGNDAQRVKHGGQGGQQEMLEAVQDAPCTALTPKIRVENSTMRIRLDRLLPAGRHRSRGRSVCAPAREPAGPPARRRWPSTTSTRLVTALASRQAAVRSLSGQQFRKDGDEGRGQRAAGHHGEQQIGQLESGVIGVQFGPDAELAGDDDVSQQADQRRPGRRMPPTRKVLRTMCRRLARWSLGSAETAGVPLRDQSSASKSARARAAGPKAGL